MDRISGIPVILTGENPQGVSAGVSLDLLQESAVKRFQPMIDEGRETLLRAERMRLTIAQKAPAWQVGRLVDVLGEDGEYQAKSFRSADFEGNWDVYMEPSPPSLFSEAQKRVDVLALMNAGVIDVAVPRNREEVRRLFNASDFGEVQLLDVRRARYENGVFLAGGSVQVHPLDDHAAHLEEHRKPFKRLDREKLDPAAMQRLIVHMQQHTVMMGPVDTRISPPSPGADAGGAPPPEGAPEGEVSESGAGEGLTVQ
jgi:hypothetical protein